jgi:hypothetical protein
VSSTRRSSVSSARVVGVAEYQNIVITGKAGTGKTYIACALGEARAGAQRSGENGPPPESVLVATNTSKPA